MAHHNRDEYQMHRFNVSATTTVIGSKAAWRRAQAIRGERERKLWKAKVWAYGAGCVITCVLFLTMRSM